MNQQYDEIRKLGAEVIAVHVECSPAGTVATKKQHRIKYPLTNDDRLEAVGHYSPTSTFLIDARGVVRARWLDLIHKRVGASEIIAAIKRLE